MRGDAASVAMRASLRARPPERVVTSDVTIGSTRVVRVQQRIGGFDVLGAEAVVLVGAEGAERTLSDSTATLPPPPVTVPNVSAIAAIDAARREAGVRELGDPAPEANLAVQRVRRSTRLVWVVELSGVRPVTEIESIVEARTGRVVRRRTLEMHDTGTARIYDPSPPVQQQSYVGLSDDKDRDSPLLDSLRLPVTLERIDQGSRCLEGAFVRVVVSDRRRPVCDDALDFSAVTRSQDGFEALMAYFHIDRLQAYIQSLGFTDILNGQFPVVANAFRADNSAFFPRLDTIRLGRGGVDDGEDADIIVHEYGHAIQDAQVPRFGRSRAALSMGEGFGDYLAAVRRPSWVRTRRARETSASASGTRSRSTARAGLPAARRPAVDAAPGPAPLRVGDPLRRDGLVEPVVGPARSDRRGRGRPQHHRPRGPRVARTRATGRDVRRGRASARVRGRDAVSVRRARRLRRRTQIAIHTALVEREIVES